MGAGVVVSTVPARRRLDAEARQLAAATSFVMVRTPSAVRLAAKPSNRSITRRAPRRSSRACWPWHEPTLDAVQRNDPGIAGVHRAAEGQGLRRRVGLAMTALPTAARRAERRAEGRAVDADDGERVCLAHRGEAVTPSIAAARPSRRRRARLPLSASNRGLRRRAPRPICHPLDRAVERDRVVTGSRSRWLRCRGIDAERGGERAGEAGDYDRVRLLSAAKPVSPSMTPTGPRHLASVSPSCTRVFASGAVEHDDPVVARVHGPLSSTSPTRRRRVDRGAAGGDDAERRGDDAARGLGNDELAALGRGGVARRRIDRQGEAGGDIVERVAGDDRVLVVMAVQRDDPLVAGVDRPGECHGARRGGRSC